MNIYFNRGGQFVSNTYMISVVQEYIYQQTGESVEIADPEILDASLRHTVDVKNKELLLKAYEWAINHLK